ncbi:4-alpha-glucanotransferase [Desulfoplanes sp.]
MDRASGILLHISSLPSDYGIGDLGPGAHRFVDYLAQSQQSYWQILPLTPTNSGTGNSPYNAYSAFAGNPLFISPDILAEQGYLRPEHLEIPGFAPDRVEYANVGMWKSHILNIAFENGLSWLPGRESYARFIGANRAWLDDYALFAALKEHFQGLPWYYWPETIKLRTPGGMGQWRERLSLETERERFKQYIFYGQWNGLKQYATDRGVRLFGDMPIYVSLDSCDVWSHPELYELDTKRMPIYVAGAPPDYFSKQGQLWGNPVYNWERMEQNGFTWWIERLRHNGSMYDLVRLDHFRGFAAYWQVPACSKTAQNGVWRPCPGRRLFQRVRTELPEVDIVAEDLGHITEDVRALMAEFGFPGMKILQFAFADDMPNNPYIPHNIGPNSVVYTGTHDNNTLLGWYTNDIGSRERRLVAEYLGTDGENSEIVWGMVRMAMMSVAELCVFPLQDLLECDSRARMNTPSKTEGNWDWRVQGDRLTRELAQKLARMTWLYGRGGTRDSTQKRALTTGKKESG